MTIRVHIGILPKWIWEGEKGAGSSGCVCWGMPHQVDAAAKTSLGWHLPHWGDDRKSSGVTVFTYLPFISWNNTPRNEDLQLLQLFGAEIYSVTPSCIFFFFIPLFTDFRQIFLVFQCWVLVLIYNACIWIKAFASTQLVREMCHFVCLVSVWPKISWLFLELQGTLSYLANCPNVYISLKNIATEVWIQYLGSHHSLSVL